LRKPPASISALKMVSSFVPDATTGMPASYKPVGQRHQSQRDVLVVDRMHAGDEHRGDALDQRQIARRMHGRQVRAQRVEVVERRAGHLGGARATSSSLGGSGAGGRSRCR
jgi:hypothetical protein